MTEPMRFAGPKRVPFRTAEEIAQLRAGVALPEPQELPEFVAARKAEAEATQARMARCDECPHQGDTATPCRLQAAEAHAAGLPAWDQCKWKHAAAANNAPGPDCLWTQEKPT